MNFVLKPCKTFHQNLLKAERVEQRKTFLLNTINKQASDRRIIDESAPVVLSVYPKRPNLDYHNRATFKMLNMCTAD